MTQIHSEKVKAYDGNDEIQDDTVQWGRQEAFNFLNHLTLENVITFTPKHD